MATAAIQAHRTATGSKSWQLWLSSMPYDHDMQHALIHQAECNSTMFQPYIIATATSHSLTVREQILR